MRPPRSLPRLALIASLLGLGLGGAIEAQQDKYPYRVSGFLGLGGSVNDDGGSLDNSTYQLGFSWASDYAINVGVRVGQVLFDEGPGEREDGADLTYATIGGEYLFNEGYYTSGIYFALGYYGLDSSAGFSSENAVGLALGLTGDFRITDRWAILVELSGHYTDLDAADVLAMGHVGVGFRF